MTTFYYSSKAGFRPSGPNPDQSGKVLGAVVRVSHPSHHAWIWEMEAFG